MVTKDQNRNFCLFVFAENECATFNPKFEKKYYRTNNTFGSFQDSLSKNKLYWTMHYLFSRNNL